MKVMKKVILASVLSAAAVGTANAAAVTACSGTAGNGTAVVSAASNFIKVGFTPKCSANVYAQGQDGVTYYATAATSSKGANYFAGSTIGGGVTGASCAAACTMSDVSTGIAAVFAVTS